MSYSIHDIILPPTVEKDAVLHKILRYIESHPSDVAAYNDVLTAIQPHMGESIPMQRGEDGATFLDDRRPRASYVGGHQGWLHGLQEREDADAEVLRRRQEIAGWYEYHDFNKQFRNLIVAETMRAAEAREFSAVKRLNVTYRRSLFLDSVVDFDSYLLYVEQNRDPAKRFYQPRRRQLIKVVNLLQGMADDKYDVVGISLSPGVGKALANDTPILTRNGWKNHGDLAVGDEVIGLDGKFKKVIAVHPKCMLDRKVTFTNGEEIVCHENHEWMIMNRHRGWNKYSTEETKQIETYELEGGKPRGHRGHRYNIMMPLRPIVEGEHKDLPLDPYTFGVWLGDGTNKEPRICFPVKDRFILFKILKNGIAARWHYEHKITHCMYFNLNMRKQLQSMGMCNRNVATPKHIPDCYLTASKEQRLELLAGLLDTDGTLIGSKYQFSTTDEALRDSFLALVATFGWRTCVTREEPKVSTSGIQGRLPVYVIGFTPDIQIPCVLERKQNKEPHKQRAIAMQSIEKVEPVEGNCITVEGDGMYLAGRTLMPTHNTTLAIFYLSWMAGLRPEEPILTGSHSNSFVRGVYDECLRIFDRKGEYLWGDVFPGIEIANTNAKDCRIDLGKRKRFDTLEFTSIGTGNAGLYRATNLLYCDDLVSGLEVALSKERLDKLWETYTTDLRQRKQGDHCKELHIATRWSVHDVIGRLERQYEDDDRARFLAIPALNENDESNFDYAGGVGFSTAFYREQREIMDDVSWRALYMNQPIEREGLLYSEGELRRFFDLPEQQPDAIIAVCDTKDRGSDYCVMPIAYQYGQDFYIVDVVCDNSNPEVVEPRLVAKCLEHKIQMARFESNSAGGRVAEGVQREIRERGGRTSISTKYTTQNKETKIIMASPVVKERFLFRDDSTVKDNQDYRRFLNFVCSYTMTGRNKHDDCVDALAMLADFIDTMSAGRVEIFRRPW